MDLNKQIEDILENFDFESAKKILKCSGIMNVAVEELKAEAKACLDSAVSEKQSVTKKFFEVDYLEFPNLYVHPQKSNPFLELKLVLVRYNSFKKFIEG